MTESTQKLIDAVAACGERIINKDSLVFSYDNNDPVGRVYHDGQIDGKGRVKVADVDLDDLKFDGVKLWAAWHWGEGCK